MVVELEDGSGTKEMDIEPEKKRAFCLTDENALAIAGIGAAVWPLCDISSRWNFIVPQMCGSSHLIMSCS